ncbi:hypothetical protein HWV62_31201 [Athelia sp. TMB]|nr:hypothetical protein HWV62_31201 [Athelia sp. TMB]
MFQIAANVLPKMQSSTSETPGSYDLESIYQDALNQLQSMRVRGQITSADYDLITTTRKPSEILGAVQGAIASQTHSDARSRVSQVVEPLLERLERFGSAIDMIVGAVPQIMGVSVLGLVWGSFKFLMIMARDVSDAFSTVLDLLEDVRNSLPTLDVYIRLFGSSNIQLLRRPLVEMYSHLMLLGIEAIKLFNRSMLGTFGKAASSGLSKDLQALTAKIAKARDEVDRVANLEHMHQNDAALKEMRSLLEKTHDGTVERPIPRINDAPVRRVSDHFIGREKELECLKSTIDSWSSDAPALFVIYGSPGRGKSQLALHYADHSFSSSRYSHIFWASATTIEKASQGVANVLDLVNHQDRHHPEQTVRLKTARLWLENADRHGCSNWLFIFDNATWDTVPFLLEHLPLQNGHDTILVTTRTLDIAEFITNAVKQKKSFLDLPPLSSAKSVELFLKRAQLDGIANVNPGDIEKLVKQFGYLPLAIDQAGAYVKQKHLRLDKVQSRDVLGDILNWENKKQVSYEQHSVAAVFNVQLQNLDAFSTDASNLLKMVAFYDPESIPINILARGAQNLKREPVSPEVVIPAMGQKPSVVRRIVAHFPWNRSKSPVPASHKSHHVDRTSNGAPSRASKLDHLVELMCSEDWLREAASHLEDLSLAQPQYGDNPSLHMHDLNQLVLQEQIAASDQEQTYYALAVTLLASAFKTITDISSPQSWAECERFVPHLMSLEKHRPTKAPPSKEFMDMSQDIARYFQKRGRYSEAETLLIRVLAQREAVYGLGVDHLDTLTTVHYLARLCIDQGQYDQADAFYARALTGREKQLGADHPDTLMTMHDLALLRYRQGRFDQAEELFTPVFAGQEKQLGPEHLDTLETAENLANVYKMQGKYNMANTLYARVLAGREEQLGPEHPDTLTAMANLGELYREQGKYDEAEPLLARVLRSMETQLGEEHPDTLDVLHSLAGLYEAQGKYDEAETLYARVLAGKEKQLSAEHPRTLVAVHNFALLRKRQGRWEEAEELYRRALAGSVKVRGDSHPETRVTMENLAYLYQRQGRDAEAEALRARLREVEQKA